ncbi:hemerythrin domain-containing protein [Rhizobium sp. YIM 134829]|uniref:hemerythrin domain-containing protein n=1 Tax=Rhizobium sp. YIM 134829 TaxID=3390453 RepID=UPI00397AB9DF
MSGLEHSKGQRSGAASTPSGERASIHHARIDLSRIHREMLSLCADLEQVADDLPDNVDRLECLALAGSLLPVMRGGQRFEEETIYPAIMRAGEEQMIRRLKTEHLEDDSSAQELTQVLLAIGQGHPIYNPEAVGYMLRAFFGTMRRHIAFERDHLILQSGGEINPLLGAPDAADHR